MSYVYKKSVEMLTEEDEKWQMWRGSGREVECRCACGRCEGVTVYRCVCVSGV